ncbi:hypothetical protein [Spirosoma rhododendri]|uniref:Uncharacterized protein n=1 Tax=Spirosoma rhododendri TaxID=2728024 RepID=A0A7L5DQX4_9BACT|nr:hypothetical protein [Spirosoma rhododendri]QJD80849.1 hypothetical protein HH216_22300 [Spirosoma rhododendri]
MAKRSPQEINQQLEHYVFSIAGHLIGSAEPSIQRALIDMASRFVTSATAEHTADGVTAANRLPDILRQPVPDLLDRSADQQFAHRAWLAGWLHQQRHYQHQHTTRLENALLVTQQRYQQIQATVLREPYRTRLLDQCRRSLDYFQQCLDLAHSTSQTTTNWLDRLAQERAV